MPSGPRRVETTLPPILPPCLLGGAARLLNRGRTEGELSPNCHGTGGGTEAELSPNCRPDTPTWGRLNRNLGGGRGGECGAGLAVTWGVGEENAGPA